MEARFWFAGSWFLAPFLAVPGGEVREKRGLVYSVASFRSGYADAGMLGVYAGTLPDKAIRRSK